MSTKVTAATLARDATQFLAFKGARGMGYRRAECVLNSFERFLRDRSGERADEVVTRWAPRIEGRKAIMVGNEFGVLRQLCLFRGRTDVHGSYPITRWHRSRSRCSCPTSSATKKGSSW